jgi:hypothetical protein
MTSVLHRESLQRFSFLLLFFGDLMSQYTGCHPVSLLNRLGILQKKKTNRLGNTANSSPAFLEEPHRSLSLPLSSSPTLPPIKQLATNDLDGQGSSLLLSFSPAPAPAAAPRRSRPLPFPSPSPSSLSRTAVGGLPKFHCPRPFSGSCLVEAKNGRSREAAVCGPEEQVRGRARMGATGDGVGRSAGMEVSLTMAAPSRYAAIAQAWPDR